MPHAKLDVTSEHVMCECKYTDAGSFSIKQSLLEKVRRESAKEGKTGIVALDISGTRCFIVPPSVVECYLEYLKKEG